MLKRGWRGRNLRSAAVSAEDQSQRPRIPAGTRWDQKRPMAQTCCGSCSAHTAALRGQSVCSGAASGGSSRRAARGGRGSELRVRRAESGRGNWGKGIGRGRRAGGCRPGGTPEEISRGQVRGSGRRPRKRSRESRCPGGASKKKARSDECWGKSCGADAAKTSSMPRWGVARSAVQPGAAPARAGLPPAKFLRRPSGTRRRFLAGGVPGGKAVDHRSGFFHAESQRDSGLQPRVARNELPWESGPPSHNPNGVAAWRTRRAATPLGL